MTTEARARLKKLVTEYQPHHPPGEFHELLEPTADIEPYLLVEECTYDGTYWLSVHKTPLDAAEYRDGQEYPEEWDFEALIDLETGEAFDIEERTTFVPRASVPGGQP